MSATARPEAETKAAQQARAVGVVSLFAGLGMVFGYARDAALAAIFGASAQTDAFYVASLIPIMVGTVIVGGALGPALLPILAARSDQESHIWLVVNSVVTLSALALLGIVGALVIGAVPLAQWMAPGFDAERAALTVRLVILTAPAVALLGLAALLGVTLNALNVYDVPAFGQALVNSAAFASLLILAPRLGIEAAALGILIGGALQFTLQALALRHRGWDYRPSLNLSHPAVRETWRLFVPLLVFVILAQCVPIVERVVASGFAAGQLSHLTFASKLYQIPGLVLSSSVAIVIFPMLARDHAAQDVSGYMSTLRAGIRNMALLTVPLSLWFFLSSPTWVRLIFQRGEFTALDTQSTADLLRWYSLAVAPAAILLVLTRAFHAMRDMVTPLYIGIANSLLYILAAWTLPRYFQLPGLPLAFVISQVAGSLMTIGVLQARLKRPLREWLDPALRGVGSGGLGLAVLLIGWLLWIEPSILGLSAPLQALVFACALGISGIVYLLIASRAGTPEARTYLSFFSMTRLYSFAARKARIKWL